MVCLGGLVGIGKILLVRNSVVDPYSVLILRLNLLICYAFMLLTEKRLTIVVVLKL